MRVILLLIPIFLIAYISNSVAQEYVWGDSEREHIWGTDVGCSWPDNCGEPALPSVAWSMQSEPQWSASGYNWRQRFTYDTTGMAATFAATITDQPVGISLPVGLKGALSDCSDIQVWTDLGFSQVQLDFEFEAHSRCDIGPAYLWVEMNEIEEDVSLIPIWVYSGYNLAWTVNPESGPNTWSNDFHVVAHMSDLTESVSGTSFSIENGSPDIVTGLLGNAYTFDGTDNIGIISLPGVPANYSWTYTAIFKRASTANQYISTLTNLSGAASIAHYVVNSSRATRSYFDTGSLVNQTSSINIYENDIWQQVTSTFEDDVEIVFFDETGIAFDTFAKVGSHMDAVASRTDLDIGSANTFADFIGEIDEVRYSLINRSDEWIEVNSKVFTDTLWTTGHIETERYKSRVVAWSDSWGSSPSFKFCGYHWPADSICYNYGNGGWSTRESLSGHSGFPDTPTLIDELENLPSSYIPIGTTHVILALGQNDWTAAWDATDCDLAPTCDADQRLQYYFHDPIENAINAAMIVGITPVLWKPSAICNPPGNGCVVPYDPSNRESGMMAAIDELATTYNLEIIDVFNTSVELMNRELYDDYYDSTGHPYNGDTDLGFRLYSKLSWEAVNRANAPIIKWYQGVPRDGLVFRLENDMSINLQGQHNAFSRDSNYWQDTAHNFNGTTGPGAGKFYRAGQTCIDIYDTPTPATPPTPTVPQTSGSPDTFCDDRPSITGPGLYDIAGSNRSFFRAVASTFDRWVVNSASYITSILPIGSDARTVFVVFRQPTNPSNTIGYGFSYGNSIDGEYIQVGNRNGNCSWQEGGGASYSYESTTVCNDGNWHILSVSIEAGGANYILYDGITEIDSGAISPVLSTSEDTDPAISMWTNRPDPNLYQDADFFAAYIYDKEVTVAERKQLVDYINSELAL